MNYYNENDPKAAAWLRELIAAGLIPAGEVDERSICDVRPDDVRGFIQVHLFAGISGWSRALHLAGWPADRPVWSCSCPCQPFSCAGKGEGIDDERHLWPVAFELIKACQPQIVFGEQVAPPDVIGSQQEAAFVDAVQRGDFTAANRIANSLVKSPALHFSARWLDGVFADLESASYTCGAADLPAAGVGAPHIRQRLYWVANSKHSQRRTEHQVVTEPHGRNGLGGSGTVGGGVADAIQPGLEGHTRNENDRDQSGRVGTAAAESVAEGGAVGGMENDIGRGCPSRGASEPGHQSGAALAGDGSSVGGLGLAHSPGSQPGQPAAASTGHGCAIEPAGGWNSQLPITNRRLGDTFSERERGGNVGGFRAAGREVGESQDGPGVANEPGDRCADVDFWSRYRLIPCRDGKVRRIPEPQSIFQPLVARISAGMGDLRDHCGGQTEEEKEIIMDAIGSFPLAGRVPGWVPLLSGAGNAINPVLAAEFIRAVMEI